VINCRGDFKNEVYQILKEKLGEKLIFSNRESKRGWFYDSSKMLSNISNDFVFFWIEDHAKISNKFFEKKDLKVLSYKKIDFIQYSFTHQSRFNELAPYIIDKDEKFNYYSIDRSKPKQKIYIISAVGLFPKIFFRKIITSNHPVLKRWPRNTPFDFEKTIFDRIFLPIKIALPRNEMFACIDDDHGQYNYSLLSRGLLKIKFDLRETLKNIEYKKPLSSKYRFLKFTPKVLKYFYNILVRIKYTIFR